MPRTLEAKLKHLEFIQLTITRMAANSFILKGWSVTLISALAVLAQKDTNPKFWMIALLPALTFWGLDGYFLRRERLFRHLYNAVRKKREYEIDFDLNPTMFENNTDTWLRCVFSKTLGFFYAAVLVSVVLIALFAYGGNKTVAPKPAVPVPAPTTATPTATKPPAVVLPAVNTPTATQPATTTRSPPEKR